MVKLSRHQTIVVCFLIKGPFYLLPSNYYFLSLSNVHQTPTNFDLIRKAVPKDFNVVDVPVETQAKRGPMTYVLCPDAREWIKRAF